jgi:hypothetical protein
MGGTYICFFHPKWSKLCTAPVMGPKNPPIKKKFKKNIFDVLFGPFKNVTFFAHLHFYRGYVNTFYSSKMEQTLHSPSYGS